MKILRSRGRTYGFTPALTAIALGGIGLAAALFAAEPMFR